jgi:hypothetical protein
LLRRCAVCDTESDESQYPQDTTQVDGLSARCVQCADKCVRDVERARVEETLTKPKKASRSTKKPWLIAKENWNKPKKRAKKVRRKWPNKQSVHDDPHRAARVKVAHAIRSGKLYKKPCETCQNPVTSAHHDDYTKPLNVRWLCQYCHDKWHSRHKQPGKR